MTHPHFRNSSHTAYVRKTMIDWKTTLETLEGSGDVQQVGLYSKTIEDTLNEHSLARWESILENLTLVDSA